MLNSPKSFRLQIGIFGKTNVGKSTLLNKITKQYTAITSALAGTTTDPVEKSMELPPIGPVTIIDTAGIDDTSELGLERTEKTLKVIDRCDIAIIVCDSNGWGVYETGLYEKLSSSKIPVIAVINKIDIKPISQKNYIKIQEFCPEPLLVSLTTETNVTELIKDLLVKNLPDSYIGSQTIVGNLIASGDIVLLVAPIDREAPKGRLILPQVQIIRDILDNDAKVIVVQPGQLQSMLSNLIFPPKLVVTDSQVFDEVSAIVPQHIPLTSFSILLAQFKGDLKTFVNSANKISLLRDGANILIAESCTHHAIEDDIAKVKIPAMLEKKTGRKFNFVYVTGHEFPDDLSSYGLIIHCGGCMTNKKEILSRIYKASQQNVPITNYGVVIAYCKGILDRVIKIFNKKL